MMTKFTSLVDEISEFKARTWFSAAQVVSESCYYGNDITDAVPTVTPSTIESSPFINLVVKNRPNFDYQRNVSIAICGMYIRNGISLNGTLELSRNTANQCLLLL